MNTTGSVAQTIGDAIDRSILHNETIQLDCRFTCGSYDSICDELLQECEGECS